MKDYIEERAVEIAYYIIEHKATVRQTAKEFGVSKSTIHKDCTDRLEQINPTLAQSVRKVLDVNKQERHIRGGLAHPGEISSPASARRIKRVIEQKALIISGINESISWDKR